MTTQVQGKQYTLEEYFDFEYASKVRHQFFDGKIVPMTYTSKSHGRIVNNLNRLLSNCLIDTAFEVYAVDRMLYIPACNQVYYPDLIILPEETETFKYKGEMEADLHPAVVMEVLSDSTEEHDRTDKWRCYQMIDFCSNMFCFRKITLTWNPSTGRVNQKNGCTFRRRGRTNPSK